MYLLDVNVLIALGDRAHQFHRLVRGWFQTNLRDGWATCPITENGFVRILGHTSYESFPGGVNDARAALAILVAAPGHQFWPDDISLGDRNLIHSLGESKSITDIYLLALAAHRQARFVTLDQRVDPQLVSDGTSAIMILQ